MFKIVGINNTEIYHLNGVPKGYKYAVYQVEVLKNGTFTDGVFSCVPPVLIGHGRGTTEERDSSTIAGKLCSGSTYYDTTLGKMLHLNEAFAVGRIEF